jgi:hypothetical protein
MTFKRLFKWLSLASLAAVLAGLVRAGPPDGPGAWFGLVLLFGWMGGPLAFPYLLSWGDEAGTARKALFAYFLVACLATAWTFYAVLTSGNSTAALDLFILPLYSWTGLAAAAFATAAATGWRPSLSDPAGPPPRQSPPPV